MRHHVDAQLGVLADQRHRRLPRRGVGDVLRLIREPLRVGREEEVVLDQVEVVVVADRNDPAVHFEHLTVPHDLERLVLVDLRVEDAPVVGGGNGLSP